MAQGGRFGKGISMIGALAGAVAFGAAARAAAPGMPGGDVVARLQRLEDEAELKHLVDTFSNLADTREIDRQVQLFAEDATVESYADGKQTSSLKGRAELAKTFGGFLAQFSTVYHMNGQQTVVITGDTATGTAYCTVTLISTKDGKTTRRTSGVRYDDRYVRQGGRWLIAARVSHFEWTATDQIPA